MMVIIYQIPINVFTMVCVEEAIIINKVNA